MVVTTDARTGARQKSAPGSSDRALLAALQGGGGPGLDGAVTVLLRAGVAAVLNASDPNVQFGSTPTAIIKLVNQALATLDRDKQVSRSFDLIDLRVNPEKGLADADFRLPDIDNSWNRHTEALTD